MKLTPEDLALYYRLRFAVLAYANEQLQVLPGAHTPEQIRAHPIEEIGRLSEALYRHSELFSHFADENPQHLDAQALDIVRSWRLHQAGVYYVVRYLKKYSVFLREGEQAHLYGVVSLTEELEEMLNGRPLPIRLATTLLPFRGRIIYDGLFSLSNITFGPGIRARFNDTYTRLKGREGIIETLEPGQGEKLIPRAGSRSGSRRPAEDWRPTLADIVTQTERMRGVEDPVQSKALALLRATAALAQSALTPEGREELERRLRSTRTALTRLERALTVDEF